MVPWGTLQIQDLATIVKILRQHNVRIYSVTAALAGNEIFGKKTSNNIEKES